jgi:hypothetical protein
MDTKRLWKEIVVDALQNLGGQATLSEIYESVKHNPNNLTRVQTNSTWEATIRYTLQQYRIFMPVERGIWRLIEVDLPQPRLEQLEPKEIEVNHDVIQGMLIVLGKVRDYDTFVPVNDQQKREFQGKKLGEWVTIKDCGENFESGNISRIKEIDVLWFGNDDDGLYPTYAFEVEHTTNVRDGMLRLLTIPQRFGAKLFIVGEADKQQRFESFTNQTPFRLHRGRFNFLSYSQVQTLYNQAVEYANARERLFDTWDGFMQDDLS